MLRWSSFVCSLALVMLVAASAPAQILDNPRLVQFVPSADHNTADGSGQPLVATYNLQIFQAGASQPFLVLDLGKPDPEPDGYIYANFSNLLASPPMPGTQLEARVAAVGSGGTSVGPFSNVFVFNSCTPAVSPVSGSIAAQGGSVSLTVSAASGCDWQSMSQSPWLTVAAGATGSGNGTVTLSAPANTASSARNGIVLVANQTVVINQPGGASSTDAPPAVQLTSPASGATFTAPATITLSASATDSDGTISSVAFYANNVLVGTATANPCSVSWSNVGAGSYSITAVATDNAGLKTTSAPVSITVATATTPPPDAPPSVQVTSPASGTPYAAPATITITANAADSDGSVSRVDFYANGSRIGSASASPFAFTWTNVWMGNYTITAVATDNAGLQTTSAGVNVSVKKRLRK